MTIGGNREAASPAPRHFVSLIWRNKIVFCVSFPPSTQNGDCRELSITCFHRLYLLNVYKKILFAKKIPSLPPGGPSKPVSRCVRHCVPNALPRMLPHRNARPAKCRAGVRGGIRFRRALLPSGKRRLLKRPAGLGGPDEFPRKQRLIKTDAALSFRMPPSRQPLCAYAELKPWTIIPT